MKWAWSILHAWKRLQVSYYGGKYSIQRLLALEAYTRSASLLRVILVCIGTPLPMVALIFTQELVPLQDPALGWQANYGFWVRVGILSFMIAHTVSCQATYFIDGVTISSHRLVLISTSVSIIFVGCSMIITDRLHFPVPFSVLILTPVFNAIHLVVFRVEVGGRVFHEMMAHREQSIRFLAFVAAQISMMYIYPAYETLFHIAKGSHGQLPVILLLPVMKVILKNVVLQCTKHVEDMVPGLVIFSVDFFNAIYVATCMQSSSSAIAILAITFTDVSQTMIMLYSLHHRTATILSRLSQVVQNSNSEKDHLLGTACFLCRSREIFAKQTRADISIHSSFPHYSSQVDSTFLATLSRTSRSLITSRSTPHWKTLDTPSRTDSPKTCTRHFVCPGKRRNNIQPFTSESVNPVQLANADEFRSTEGSALALHQVTSDMTILRELLEALFTTECLVVTAYLEAVVPLFYCIYISVMAHLPSAQYHTEMARVTRDNVGTTIFPVFVFGLLQIASFAMLLALVKRKCRMQALYQLAFVLETQKALIQGKLMVWMVITLSFRVVHFGTFHTALIDVLQWPWMESRCG